MNDNTNDREMLIILSVLFFITLCVFAGVHSYQMKHAAYYNAIEEY